MSLVLATDRNAVVGVILPVVGVAMALAGIGFLTDYRGWATRSLLWRSRTLFQGRTPSDQAVARLRRGSGTVYLLLGVTFVVFGIIFS